MNAHPFADPPSSASAGDAPHDELPYGVTIVPASDADEYEPDVVAARRPVETTARARRHHLLLGEE